MTKLIENNFPFEELYPVAERESYRKEINRPIYHTHKWWAQRLGSVFRALTIGSVKSGDKDIWQLFYEKHEYDGAIILDPFMGSGTTIGEALKIGCKAIGCDINPISSFIVSQALKNISQTKLVEAFDEIEGKVKKKINKYYQKKHPKTGSNCQVLYFFWVKLVTTPSGKEIPLFQNFIFSTNAYKNSKPLAKIVCPRCYSILEARFDITYLICNSCNLSFNPQVGPAQGQFVIDSDTGEKFKIMDLVSETGLPPQHKLYCAMVLNNKNEKEYLSIDKFDIDLYNEAANKVKENVLKFPEGSVLPGYNTNQVLKYNYKLWSQFFNDRQLLCLNILLEAILEIPEIEIKDAFLCLFSGTLEFNNMFCSFKGEGTGAVRHLFSNHILKPERTPLENSIWGTNKSSGTFMTLFKSRLLKAQEYRDKPFEISAVGEAKIYCSNKLNFKEATSYNELFQQKKPSYLILNGDSSHLPLPDQSVDAVVTDLPYFDFVHYSELSDFYYAWLKPVLSKNNLTFSEPTSRRPGEVQQNNPSFFANTLGNVFSECNRVMKNDAVLVFSFHHSKVEGWLSIYKAIEIANLKIVKIFPIKAELSLSAPKSASKSPINIDAIFVCKKGNHFEKIFNISELWRLSFLAYRELESRLIKINRQPSDGDKRVIMVAAFLNQCSIFNIPCDEVSKILQGMDLNDIIIKAQFCNLELA